MTPAPTFPEPSNEFSDPADLFVRYLDFYRLTVEAKLEGLTDEQLRSTLLPSGWTPLELLKHLVFMEQRWIRWGFLGESLAEPWGDRDPVADRWAVRDDDTLAGGVALLHAGGLATAQVVRAHSLDELSAKTGRFEGEAPAPTLAWILFHVLQEYARHAGHLDVVRELIDGRTGE
ncbi:MAG: DinB family protein [Nocardioidaceae bacterium]